MQHTKHLPSVILALGSWCACAAMAQPADVPAPIDIQHYAADFGVSEADAGTFLSYQASISEMGQRIRDMDPLMDSGVFVTNGGRYSVTINVAKQGEFGRRRAAINKMIKGMPWRKFARVRYVDHTLAELTDAQRNIDLVMAQSAMAYDSMVSVADNAVSLMVTDRAALQAELDRSGSVLPDGVVVKEVTGLMEPEVVVSGGERVIMFDVPTSRFVCTTGFTARDEFGRNGVLTAGHCRQNMQLSDGTVLPVSIESYQGSRDVQWHRTGSAASVSGSFFDGNAFRQVDRTVSLFEQSIGNYVCKNGATTGYTCGVIGSTSYRPSYVPAGTASFVYVEGGSTNLSSGGDSGGPWFLGNRAFGTHSGGGRVGSSIDNDAIYMPIERIDALGLRVITLR